MLGYLIAHDRALWEPFFSLNNAISSVDIEADYERDRADILIETPSERIVVEAKVVWTDPKNQVKKYDADRKFLLTNYVPNTEQKSSGLKYISWERVAQFLQSLASKTGKPYVRHLAKELIMYMREHQLIRTKDSIEIYARELNDELTVNTFLKCHIYGCWLEKKGGTISRALYFAPHFGQWVARQHPGIYSGLSYVAKIEAVEVVDSWPSFITAAKRHPGGWWVKKHKRILDEMRQRWGHWDEKHQRSFAFLGSPRLVFNPPINKDLLQKGKGFLSRRTYSFDELFEAWSRSSSARIR